MGEFGIVNISQRLQRRSKRKQTPRLTKATFAVAAQIQQIAMQVEWRERKERKTNEKGDPHSLRNSIRAIGSRLSTLRPLSKWEHGPGPNVHGICAPVGGCGPTTQAEQWSLLTHQKFFTQHAPHLICKVSVPVCASRTSTRMLPSLVRCKRRTMISVVSQTT